MDTDYAQRVRQFIEESRRGAERAQGAEHNFDPLVDFSDSIRGYSFSEAKIGDKITTAFANKENVSLMLTDRMGNKQRYELTVPQQEALINETEYYTFMILQSAVLDVAQKVVAKSGYNSELKDPGEAMVRVREFFKNLKVERSEDRISRRDQRLIALLGANFLTGWKVDISPDSEDIVVYNDVGQGHIDYGDQYLEPTVVITLARSLYTARYQIPEQIADMFNNADMMNLYYRGNVWGMKKTAMTEAPNNVYDALASSQIRKVFNGLDPRDMALESMDDRNELLGG